MNLDQLAYWQRQAEFWQAQYVESKWVSDELKDLVQEYKMLYHKSRIDQVKPECF